MNTYVVANLVDAMNKATPEKLAKSSAEEMVNVAKILNEWGSGAKDKNPEEIAQATKTAINQALSKAVAELAKTTEHLSNDGEKSGASLLMHRVLEENAQNPLAAARGLISINQHIKDRDFDTLMTAGRGSDYEHHKSEFDGLSSLHDALDTVHQDTQGTPTPTYLG